ncbi:serine/threonine protein kinase [Candidatus Kaiserbacteria bacterium]|nr:serine/threonine protein kinase [Candidatus Kaiserbacteria bacterium]
MSTLIGTTLGPYRILEQIGLGGMATVYKAYQPGMDRLVALKVLPHHYARDPRFTKRFEQEARVIAKLEHRNIVPVYDFGEQDGTAYLAMRYLQAGTVKEILSHGPLPLGDAAKLLNDIASALDYAHSQGIIHRDVKPSNVLVDKQGSAYLTDFGIAKVIESTMEMTGSAALGTPAYMAPEQTLGKAVTPQSDVYSLGVMLYEMVTGKPPFEADTPMAIALMHVHEPLPLPRKVKPDLPEGVELGILKALAKEPKDRFGSASELARAFSEAAGAEMAAVSSRLVELASVAATGKGGEEVTYDIREEIQKRERTEQRKRWAQRAPTVIGLVVILGLVFGLITLVYQQTQSQTTLTEVAMAATIEAGKPTATPKPTDAPEPTATIDIHAAATLQKQATQQQAQINATIYSELRTQNAKTESALATIRALTPSNTPTITPSPTHTLPSLPTATPTLVKTVFLLNNCNLASLSAPAGLIIFMVGAAWAFDTTTTTRESQQDQTKVIFGDSAAVITVDDKPIQPMLISPQGLPLDDRGRTDLREETPGLWGYETYAQIVLASGVYAVRSEWRRANGATEINSCSVTIK